MPLAGSHRLARAAVERSLSSDHPLVVLVGPLGSGRTAALRHLAAEVRSAGESVEWPASLPDPGEETTGLLLLDDVPERESGFWEDAAALVRRRPGLRVRVATTSASGLPAGIDAAVVDALALGDDEVAEALAAHGSPADPALVAALTHGHLGATAQVGASGAATEERIRAVLARAPGAVRLTGDEAALAVPTYLNPGVLTALDLPADLLADLEQRGLGWWAGGPATPWFVLVPGVREATRAALDPAITQRSAGIGLAAAEALLAEDLAFPAFVEAVRAGALEVADRAVKRGGLLLVADHMGALVRLLQPLPTRQLSRYPVLSFTLALGLNAERRSRLRAAEFFSLSVVGTRLDPRRTPPDRALMRVVESVALRVSGAGDGGVGTARKAVGVLDGMAPEARAELRSLEPDMRAHLAISLMYGGHDEEARAQFEHATGSSPGAWTELLALGGLALLEALRGDVVEARAWLATADARSWPRETADGYSGSLLHIARATVAVERLEFEEALRALAPVEAILDTIEHWGPAIEARAMAQLGTGRPREALEAFRRVRRLRTGPLGTTRWLKDRLDLTEVLLLLANNDAPGARALLGRTPRGGELRLAAVLLHLLEGDDERAVALLGSVEAATPLERMAAAGLRAVALRRRGDVAGHAVAAGEVRAIAEQYELKSPLLFLPPEEREHLGLAPDDLPSLVRTQRSVPQLTPREQVVLRHLVATADVATIADQLHVSVNTVKSQRRSLYRKLEASSRDEALARALGLGLLGD